MHLKLLSCEVFTRETSLFVANTPHIVDPEYLPKGAHDESDKLRDILTAKIKEAEDEGVYDGILLCYGLCGNSIVGLRAQSLPLVIPRAHDCCTLFLGSKESFIEHFGDRLSAQWSSAGYLERGESYVRESDVHDALGTNQSYEELVAEYGEENARYVWETLHPDTGRDQLIYIEIKETAHLGYEGKIREEADREDKEFVKIDGDISIIRDLIYGDWDSDRFLIVNPGEMVEAVYDHNEIIRSGKIREV